MTLAALTVAAANGVAQQASGALQGRILGEEGQPLGGATVRVHRTHLGPRSRYESGPAVLGAHLATSRTAADGGFNFASLPAGPITVCAAAGQGWLDPCQWTTAPPSVTLRAGEQRTGFEVRLERGSVVRLRLDDPGGHLERSPGLGREPHLHVAVAGPSGLLHPFAIAGVSNSSRTLECTIPFGLAVDLGISSRELAITDDNGAPTDPAGHKVRVRHERGRDNSRPLLFRVTGPR